MPKTYVLKDWTPKELLSILMAHSRNEIYEAMPDVQIDVNLETYSDGHGGLGLRLIGHQSEEPAPAEENDDEPAEEKGPSLATEVLATLLGMAGHQDAADLLVDQAEDD